MADVASLERALTPRLLRDSREDFTSAPVVMLDGNLSAEALQAGHRGVWPLFRPSSVFKDRQT